MKCSKCGFEVQEGFGFCAKCGTAVDSTPQPEQPITFEQPVYNPFAERILSALQDNAFLTICILMAVSCVFSIAAEAFNIINVLITVFLWLVFASARKGIVSAEQLRNVSGCVYANYVIINVSSIICIVCGIITALSFGFLTSNPALLNEIMNELNLPLDLVFNIAGLSLSVLGWIIGFVLLATAIILLIFNVLGMRKIHRFAKSVYQSVNSPVPYFEKPLAAKNWLMFFGVCSAISAVMCLADITLAFSYGCQGAAAIMASGMIGKYFSFQQNNIL